MQIVKELRSVEGYLVLLVWDQKPSVDDPAALGKWRVFQELGSVPEKPTEYTVMNTYGEQIPKPRR